MSGKFFGVKQNTGAAGADGADGDATAYTAANAADWNGSAPTTIADALDRLAAALGPIA